MTIREEITAAICEVFHPQPNPADRHHCGHGAKAADEVLRIIVGKFRTTRPDPEAPWTHDWDQLQSEVMICLGIDDPERYGGLPSKPNGVTQ